MWGLSRIFWHYVQKHTVNWAVCCCPTLSGQWCPLFVGPVWPNMLNTPKSSTVSLYVHSYLDTLVAGESLNTMTIACHTLKKHAQVPGRQSPIQVVTVPRVLVKCGIAECGMRKVKCGIQNCGNGCGTVGKMRNAERVYWESKPTQLTCESPGHEYGV